ncbi:class Ib ribonucleoside-diphosphate reductase assembly flavoprotein NrdI [Vannielia litorea]|uniref:class Ib ribonucleoside-diphosphate reductase assembly flavoprotein NrdI n=1 Tax=Vannielia litorea TaxID=1217970 RepID=UPI001BD0A2CD|nr:class Ib ribonucleoside-diphosphate reductase assembly flavoprotein NrdI [Vannielia litorea]MBS8225142.1 class Ib ribonucleoside-diphosphate reductase assembly flavoprotein NrdI [Vannielia litorea]
MGAARGHLVYFSSGSGNTARLVEKLGLPATRLPLSATAPVPEITAPFVLITPTYADGEGRGAVAKPVIAFLNRAENRALLRGVIAGGNRNFGATFARAGEVIAAKCNVPLLYRFELAGTETDIARIRAGLGKFWGTQCLTPA